MRADGVELKTLTRFPPEVWQAFFCKGFGAPIYKMLDHAEARTVCSCNMNTDPRSDHILTCKKYTGSTCSHSRLIFECR